MRQPKSHTLSQSTQVNAQPKLTKNMPAQHTTTDRKVLVVTAPSQKAGVGVPKTVLWLIKY
jgi:hypothetical protein